MLAPTGETRSLERAPFLSEIAQGPEGGSAWWLRAKDGTRIRLGVWPTGQQGTILMFPGRTEYIEKYGRLARDLSKQGFGMIAVDWRGQGLADRPQHKRDLGHVVDFDEYQEDVQAVVAALEELDLPRPWLLIGHSMGGAIGLRALYEGLPVVSTVFSAPMWGIQMSPIAKSLTSVVLGLTAPFGLDANFAPTTGPAKPMEFDDNQLTTDRDNFEYMEGQVAAHPELALGGPSIRWVDAALKETRALMQRPAPKMPTLTFLGTRERIVETEAIHTRMADWPGGELIMVEGSEHEILMEAPHRRDPVVQQIGGWFARFC